MTSSRILAPSAENVNFSRIIALLIDGGQLALRYQFDQQVLPSCLGNYLRQGRIRKTLADMKGKGTLNNTQWDRLYPPIAGPPVSSENFDISLLTCLLRNICGLNPPHTGWDNPPSPGDISPQADIVRIRLLRNEMQHMTAASLSNQDFQTKWDEIEQILTRLGNGIPHITASINRLKYDPWDPDKEKEHQDILQIWMDSDKVLRDRIEDIDQRTSTLEANYEDLRHCVAQQTHNQDTAIERVESKIIYLRNEEEIQNDKITLRQAIQASQIQIVEEKVTEIARRHDMNPVLKNMHETSVVWLSDIKKHRLKNFIETKSFHQAVDILRNKGVLILSGGPGEGKTTTAAAVLLHTSTPQRCLVVRSPNDWKHVDPLSFDVIFIDNIFGEININIEWLNNWMPYLEDMWAMVRERKTSFIIALREHIFENCKPKLKRAELFKPNFCLRLSSVDLSDEEKARILEQYLLHRNRRFSKNFVNDCVRNYSGLLGFPECAEIFATNDNSYSRRGPEFFTKPFKFLEKCLDTLYGDREEEFLPFAVLWIMHNRNQKVTKELLSSSVDLRSVLDSLDLHDVNSRSIEKSYTGHSMHGGFITYSKVDGSYDFGHAAVKDMVGLIVMRNYPHIAIQECKFEFILEYICVSERESDELKYKVEPWLHCSLADRFIQHATESFAQQPYLRAYQHFSWLEHEILKDTAFIVSFVQRVKERGKINEIFGFSSRLVSQVVYSGEEKFENISIFAYALCCLPFSNYRTIENVINTQFAEQIIHLGILDEVSNKEFIVSQKTIALLFGMRSRKSSIVNKIVKSGTVIDINCLCMAVYQDYIDIVRICIENKNVDINGIAEMMNGSTALGIAAKTGNMDMVMYLIKHGANINVIDRNKVSPLRRAIMNNHEDIVKTLINNGGDIFSKMGRLQNTPLHLSAERGLDNIVKVLLEKGASTNKRDIRGHTPLHRASMNGHACTVNILLQHDRSQVNKRAFCNSKKERRGSGIRGVTALHYAARQGYVNVADIVLQAGGEVNIKDSFGQTPLYVASNFGHLDVVQLLVSKGANVNIAENHGFTPLHVAVYRERTEVVKFLVERATIDALDKYGKTPLHVACQEGYIDIVNILLTHNSNWRLGTYTDNTVLHYACRYGNKEIAEEFTKRDMEMLYVKNSKTFGNRKEPLKEAVMHWGLNYFSKLLKLTEMSYPYDLPNGINLSETNSEEEIPDIEKEVRHGVLEKEVRHEEEIPDLEKEVRHGVLEIEFRHGVRLLYIHSVVRPPKKHKKSVRSMILQN